MLGDQLGMQPISTVFRELRFAFRIAPSRLHSDKTQCEKVVVGLLKGVDVDTYDICLLNGDTIGFKALGEDCSYHQNILFQDISVRPHRLRQIGVYSNVLNEPLS